jgi:hypothetical protein
VARVEPRGQRGYLMERRGNALGREVHGDAGRDHDCHLMRIKAGVRKTVPPCATGPKVDRYEPQPLGDVEPNSVSRRRFQAWGPGRSISDTVS